jgi:hypothetical protein
LPTPSFPAARRECSRRPGRASASRSWTDDKIGRASASRSWIADKIAAASADEGRLGRATSVTWTAGKRAASSAPSADRSDKKQKPLVAEEEAAPAIADKFAGPSFTLSPDPSQLPLPTFLLLPRQDCVAC